MTLAEPPTYYDLLGVAPQAPTEEIRAAFRAAVARCHPDVSASEDAAALTMQLNEAWRTLREPLLRALYDASLGLIDGALARPGEGNLPLLSCERCGSTTPRLRYATFLRATPSGTDEVSASLCPDCREREARRSATISVLAGMWRPGGWNNVKAALATDTPGGSLDAETNAILLRHIGLAFAQRDRASDAVIALNGALEFEPNDRIAALAQSLGRTAARLEAQAADTNGAATANAYGAAAAPPNGVATAVRETGSSRVQWISAIAVVVVIAIVSGWRLESSFARHKHPVVATHRRASAIFAAFAPRKWPVLARVAQFAEKSKDVAAAADSSSDGYLFDLARDSDFSAAYATALNDLPFDDRTAHIWLVTLETTSVPNEFVRTPASGTYLLAAGCKPNDCADGRLELAYNRETHAIAGNAYYDGRWHAFGSSLADDHAMLALDEALDRLELNTHFPLSRPTEERVERYVAALIP